MICAPFSKVFVFGMFLVVLAACGCGSGGNGAAKTSAPAVSGITPSVLKASSLSQTITVTGTNFQSGLTVTVTTSSGSASPAASQVTATSFQISAVFVAGSYAVTVKNSDGGGSSPFSFTVKSASGINFAAPVNYSTGATTSGPGGGSASIAIADYNGDGKLDIAVSNYASNTVAVFLNKGDGSFGAPLLTTVDPIGALGLGAIVTGDFNEDGKMDLIVATIAGLQSDIVLLGNGDGTFTEGAAIPNSFGFFQARAVDLNGDKHLDVAAGGNGNMTVALGNGDGTFSPATFASNGPFPDAYLGIDVGDITGTGKLAVVAADTYSPAIVTFPVNGDGTLGTPGAQTTPASQPDSVSLADFNGDGKLDLLIGYGIGSATVALGNGDGTFNLNDETSVYTSSAPSNGVSAWVADLDQDGKPDALVLDYLGGQFTVVLNDANTIAAGSTHNFTLAPGVSDLAVGDLNGDGMPDVVVVNDKTNQISVFLSQK
jgi:FG-GAP-like repeat/IPT/TIG domain